MRSDSKKEKKRKNKGTREWEETKQEFKVVPSMRMGSYGFLRPRESWDVWRYHPTIIHLTNPQANLKEMLSFSGNSKQIFLYSTPYIKIQIIINKTNKYKKRQKRVMRYSWRDPMTWLSLTLISLTVQKETATDSFETTREINI